MHKFQLNRAVKIAGEMIKAFYIKGDVEKVLSYINSNNFTWIGGSVDQILTNIEDVRKFFYRFVDVIRESLDFLSEDYQVVASSEDSCVIVSKIILRDKQHSNQVKLFFSFYFQIVDKKILCSSYHVHHLDLNCGCPLYQFVYNDEIKIDSPRLDMTKIAMKSFLLEDCLPYIYINLQFIELIGYKRLRNFIAMSQKSSLSQIHPADQSRYVEVLNRCRSKLKDQNSYFVSYRTQSPEQIDQDSSQVFEWGMISKIDDRFVVNALVFPIEEVEEIKNSDSSFFFRFNSRGGGAVFTARQRLRNSCRGFSRHIFKAAAS
ncbi:MAG: nuclear transport factor 2 family protein [Selenomonadaceae bacterium]|nr:nuclear transport factor 2 family protein [Selenomonadaceae bacterium]